MEVKEEEKGEFKRRGNELPKRLPTGSKGKSAGSLRKKVTGDAEKRFVRGEPGKEGVRKGNLVEEKEGKGRSGKKKQQREGG